MMNMVNTSIDYSLFQLCSGFSPQLISPIIKIIYSIESDTFKVISILKWLQNDIKDAQDSHIMTKIRQAHKANAH